MRHLIIDGRNNVYRLVFAGLAANKHEPVESFIRSIVSFINKFTPNSVHITWDYDGENWRKILYPPYKDRSNQRKKWAEKYGVDVPTKVNEVTDHIMDLISHTPIRQYKYKYQEADDLMYALHTVLSDEKIIISSDGDVTQLIDTQTSIFNPLIDSVVAKPTMDVVKMKCLEGDTSDNINGFNGIGHAKAKDLIENAEKLEKFLSEGDRRTYYELYNKIIDLKQNPFNDINIKYAREVSNQVVNKFKLSDFGNQIRRKQLSNLILDMPKIQKALCTLV